jgi:hypothetical protein
MIHGIDESALKAVASAVQSDPGQGRVRFSATTE